MDDAFFPSELAKEFELADAEYTFTGAEMEVDTAVSSERESTDAEDEVEVNFSVREEDEIEEKEVASTPRKCQLFGVCSEAKGEQVHYLIDENDSPGKGANCVVSLLHHYLESKTSIGQHLLHADNAVAWAKQK